MFGGVLELSRSPEDLPGLCNSPYECNSGRYDGTGGHGRLGGGGGGGGLCVGVGQSLPQPQPSLIYTPGP